MNRRTFSNLNGAHNHVLGEEYGRKNSTHVQQVEGLLQDTAERYRHLYWVLNQCPLGIAFGNLIMNLKEKVPKSLRVLRRTE